MAKRTFVDPRNNRTYRKGKTNEREYSQWMNSYPHTDMKCSNPENASNPAWLTSNVSEDDLMKAQEVCGTCPLQAGCEFFVGTKVFDEFDGVMGGIIVEDNLCEEDISEKV